MDAGLVFLIWAFSGVSRTSVPLVLCIWVFSDMDSDPLSMHSTRLLSDSPAQHFSLVRELLDVLWAAHFLSHFDAFVAFIAPDIRCAHPGLVLCFPLCTCVRRTSYVLLQPRKPLCDWSQVTVERNSTSERANGFWNEISQTIDATCNIKTAILKQY